MKTGLVLEGGAMRGMFTAGVLDTFLDHGIQFNSIVGVSAGASFGVNFLSEQKGRAVRYCKRFNRNRNYLGAKPLLREGNIFSTQFAYEIVPRRLDPFDDVRYRKSTTPFYAVVTNVKTGKPEYIQIRSVFEQMDVLRASCSMPFVSKMVEIGGQSYLDGGISDSVPFQWMHDQGCDKLVVILTRDMTYRKKPMSAALIKTFYRGYPELANVLRQRHAVYNGSIQTLAKWEKAGKAFVIRPSSPIRISRTEKDPEKLQMTYDLGRRDGTALMGRLAAYMCVSS